MQPATKERGWQRHVRRRRELFLEQKQKEGVRERDKFSVLWVPEKSTILPQRYRMCGENLEDEKVAALLEWYSV
jgi:hypothetical protein